MEELITSFIIQSKECKLPDVGRFRVVVSSAELDIANKQIAPPVMEFLFTGREEKISDDLVKYVAEKKNMEVSEALAAIKKWCIDTKHRLKNGEEIVLDSLGSLKKGVSGNTLFHSNHRTFFEPVPAERVIHKNTEHTVLVGDIETTSAAMNLMLNEEEVIPNKGWKILSFILLSLVIVMLLFYFYTHSFSFAAIGNQITIPLHSTPATYTAY